MWCLVLTSAVSAVDANLREGVTVLPDGSLEHATLAKRAAVSLLQQDDKERAVPSHLGRVLQRTRSLIAPEEEVVAAHVVVPRKDQLHARVPEGAPERDLALAHKADQGAFDPHDVEGVFAGPMSNVAAGGKVPDPKDWSVTVCAGTGVAPSEEPLNTLCSARMHFQEADAAMRQWRQGDLAKNIRDSEQKQGRPDRAKDFVLTEAVPAGEIVALFEPRAAAAPDLQPGQADIRKFRVLALPAAKFLELFDQKLHGGFRGVFLDREDHHAFAKYRTAMVVSHGQHVARNWGGNVSVPALVTQAAPQADTTPADPEAVAKLQQRVALETEREQLEDTRERPVPQEMRQDREAPHSRPHHPEHYHSGEHEHHHHHDGLRDGGERSRERAHERLHHRHH